MNSSPVSTAKRLKPKSSIWVLVFVVAFMVVVSMTLARKSLARRGPEIPPVAEVPDDQEPVSKAYGKLPLSFERNDGQAPDAVRFMSRGVGYSLFLTANEAVLTLRGHSAAKTGDATQTNATEGYKVVRMKLIGANANPETVGLEELPGKLNYFTGNDPAKWTTDVSLFAKVQYRSVYKGIDLLYYGNQRQLEYDFQVAPGHDPLAIKLEFEGADRIKVDEKDGSLVLGIEHSEVRFKRPVIYQLSEDGGREEIEGGYSVKGKVVQFRVASFDARKPLVIDPILSYSTYLGSNSNEIGWGIAVDSSGSAYVAGQTGSPTFPTTGVNFIPQNTSGHAFVTKLDPSGSSLVYSTLIGGSSGNAAFAIAIDAAGSVAITGRTNSGDFPTVNAIRANTNLVKSTNSGASWAASNSGLGNLSVNDLAVNPQAPATMYAGVSGGSGIYKSSDSGATWSGLNTGATFVTALAVDPQTPATIYATVNAPSFGAIKSADAGATWSQINTGLNGGFVYAIAVDPQAPATIYTGTNGGVFKSTNGGTSWQSSNTGLTSPPFSIAIDPSAPTTLYVAAGGGGVFKSTNSGGNWTQMKTGLTDAIVTSLLIDPTNSSTIYAGTASSGIFKTTNGAGNWSPVNTGLTVTAVRSLAFDQAGGAVYAGTAKSTVFKSVNGGGSWASVYTGLTGSTVEALAVAGANIYAGVDIGLSQLDSEAFVTKLNPAGNALLFSTYLGGSGHEDGLGIAIDGGGNVVVTGQTESSDFPVASPLQESLQGTMDAFVTKFAPGGTSLVYSTYLGGTLTESSRGVAVDSSGNAYVAGVTSSTNFPITPGVFQTTLASGPDAFVTKIDAAGGQYVYSTFLGGNNADAAFGIAIDTSGNAFVAGSTSSSNFPLVNPVQPVVQSFGGAFVTKLNATGSALSYSSFLGGNFMDQARGIAVDGGGNAYVTGLTRSPNFPTTFGALRSKSSFYQSTDGGANWSNDNSGLGGAVNDIAINPTSLVLYAATLGGVYRSNNLGLTWTASNSGLTNLPTSVLAIAPQSPDTLYVGQGSSGAGIFKSTNGGASWSLANGNQNFTDIAAIAIDPVNTNTVYVSSVFSCFKTTNGGTTWNPIGSGQLSFISSLAVDPQNPQIVYATNTNSGGGVLKSIDGGATWNAVNNGLNASASRIVIDPVNTSNLYVGTNLGVFKSTDAGGSWSNVFNASFASNLTIDPASPSTVYAMSFNGGAIYRTLNGGANWSTLGEGVIRSAGRLLINPQLTNTLYVVGNPGSSDEDAFVTKFSPTGNLAYSTYLGGQSNPGDTATDQGFAIAADAAGNAYVTGLARSKDFPLTADAFQPFNRGFDDAFVARLSPSFSISGVVTNAGATPQGGVKITLSGSATNALITGVDGSYLFTNLAPGGNYTVSATRTGFSFAPPLQSFSNLSADQTANFTLSPSATPFHTISGRIAEADDTPIPNVTVSLTGSQIEFATTNSTGNYSFSAPAGGNHTVTPTNLGFVFSPPSQSVNNLAANTQVNFSGTRQSFVVTNTNDHGAGSLRQAIINSNATIGADRIVFQIPGSGVQTIRPTSPMPEIKDPVTLDATTQPGFAGSPLIELDGSNNVSGLTISGGNSTVRGLVINRFFDGINLRTLGGNRIEGNIIGLDPTGTIKRPNVSGITISGSSGNFIGGVTPAQRNVISGNSANGIQLLASGNQIKGNYIGTNASGTAGLGNGHAITMVNISGQSSDANQIGGTEPGARNVISGNGDGIDVEGAGTIIQGNLIGTDVSGTAKIGNEGFGVNVEASGVVLGGTTAAARNIISGNGTGVSVGLFFGTNPFIIFKGNYIGTDISGTAKLGNGTGVAFTGRGTLGGTEPGAGNLISGNDGPGVQLNCCGPGSTLVQGNLIGTDVTGLLPLGNAKGIHIESSQNMIGGALAGARNVISGNGVGIQIGGLTAPGPFANIVQGNYIGVNALGNAPLGNSSRGLELNDSSNTVFGGSQPGEGNVLAFNSVGVVASQSVINTLIRGNSIFSNSSLGIDLNFDGVVTANDPGDPDTGSNRLQNFPVISSITPGSGSTRVTGTLNSTPATQFQIDFYSNLACDVSGNGEGAAFFGSTMVTTDADGNAVFDVNIASQLLTNRTLTATATDPAGNTSEFSRCDASGTAGSLEFGAVDFNAREDVGNALIRVVRTGGSRGTLTVNYATGAGSATAGSDYTPASGSLTFAEGETEKSFSVPIANDGLTESDETVALTLSGVTNLESLGAKYRATLHIFDSDTALTISGNDAQIVEGDVGQRSVVVPVTLSVASGQTVTVNYASASGGSSSLATSGKDFLPVTGTLVFGPGIETQNVMVPVLADALDEFDETFLVILTGAVNATVVRISIVKIFDDDPLPSVTVSDVSVVEANGATAVFTVRLSAASGRTAQLTYATANGTATSGSDYTNTGSFISFAAGQTVQQVSVPILTDGTAEPDETFFLNLANPLRATIADGQGLGTIIDASASTTLIRFSAATYAVNEADGQVQITVTRLGNTVSESAVSYQAISGAASDRSDFTPSFGTLRFAAGETSKTFNVLVTDDAFLEAAESVDLILSNPVGAVLGGPNVASLVITSNDVADGPSPVREQSFDTAFFVRQHYHDFLNREPDTAGLNFWVDQIESCGADAACREVRRINVSAAFFLSIEFQETGYLAYRMYNAGYGETTSPNVAGTVPIVRLQDFLPDSQQIGQGVQVGIGNWQQQLEDNKVAYAVDFVQRQRFINAFPLTMTADEFVNKLDQNTNGVLSAAEKAQLVVMLAMPAAAGQRGAVVRKVAEDSDLRQRELNRAFVLMQFYGYLRRNPDDPQDTDFRGWKFWLDKLNEFNGNFVNAEMVKAFLVSAEYRQRFGTP